MEARRAGDVTERKRRFAALLRNSAVLRFGLSLVARVLAPRPPVGAVGALFDGDGRVLLVEHVFRTDFPWGLPGGWVRRGEDPAHAVAREIREELGLTVEVGPLLLTEPVGRTSRSTHPPHLGLAYACSLVGGTASLSAEVVSIEWTHPHEIRHELAPLQHKAVLLAADALARAKRDATRQPRNSANQALE